MTYRGPLRDPVEALLVLLLLIFATIASGLR
jgi:hypothetical protein